MRKSVLAILCSDLHLSLKHPLIRIKEPDWMQAQKRVLLQITAIATKYQAPVVFAGDLFDRWDSPAELITFALSYLPDPFYAIPGPSLSSLGGQGEKCLRNSGDGRQGQTER